MSGLENQSLNKLYFKKELLEQIIRENSGDPRVGEPKRQLRIILDEIKRREQPEDLVVGLDTLKMKIRKD